MQPLGLYLHIPYCLHKCGYCDFNSHPLQDEDTAPYITALQREIACRARGSLTDRPVTSVFFGGGTPTVLPSNSLTQLLQSLKNHFSLTPDCEITCEANPASIHPGYLDSLRQAGFNRLSVGVQSFQQDELKRLDRIHTIDEVYSTVEQARSAGFDNFSLDLMFGLPDQDPSRWLENLECALALGPGHLSCYNLTVEPNTAFFNLKVQGQLHLPTEDSQLEMYQLTRQKLENAGFEHYEISNYAQPGLQCRHNLLYWENGEYLGFGAGASSYLEGDRFQNVKPPSQYIREIIQQNSAVGSHEVLPERDAMGEAVMLGLRVRAGLDLARFENRFEVPFQSVFGSKLDRLLQHQLITLEGGRLALSEKGLVLADSVILEFLP